MKGVKVKRIKDSMLRSDLQETAPSRFQRTRDIFRLKKAYKNLPTETFAINLKTYLKNVHRHVDITMSDFITALNTL